MPAYFVNDIYDGGSILSPESQNNVSILLVINERCHLLVIDIRRCETPPL